ncbi:MAG: ABC transporter permease [Acidobacteriota bacterium]|nr:MAG: ABC transporter permease [Acidobacteriota bacterium]
MLAKMAWRNLWRHKRRSLLTLLSIAFGGFLAILFTALQDRSFADFIDTAARLGSGHVTIQHPEYLETPTLNRTVQLTGQIRNLPERDRLVLHVTERITGQAIVATANDSFGVVFIAYDPARETEGTLTFGEGLIEGEMFKTANDRGIILGTKLAQNLGAGLGNKVVYTMTDRNGEIVSGMARLTGVIETGAPSLDQGLCLVPISALREVLNYGPNEATQIGIFLSDSRRSSLVASNLNRELGPDSTALTWDEVQPDLSAFIAMKVGGARFMEILIAILVAAGIFNTLFVSVMERVREFGIMVAIGYSAGQLFRLVMWESLWLALTGLAACGALTIWPYYYLSQHGIDFSQLVGGQDMEIAGVGFSPVVRVGIFPEHLIVIVLAIVAATLAAGLYPAWKAGKVEPVESISLV